MNKPVGLRAEISFESSVSRGPTETIDVDSPEIEFVSSETKKREAANPKP